MGLILALVVSMGIGLFLADAHGVPYRAIGALLWGGVLFTAFFFGLIYFAQFVLPLQDNDGWTEGWRLLTRHYSAPFASATINRMRNKPRDSGHLPGSFRALRAGLLPSSQVLAIAKGTGYSRSAGPGFVMLYGGEFVTDVIDLRRHLRALPVKAITRDGIPIETTVTAIFRIRQTDTMDPADPLPHPYDKDGIFLASYAHTIAAKEKVRSWAGQLAPRLGELLTAELAQLTLNQLYDINDPDSNPIAELKRRLKNALTRDAEQQGVEVLGVGVSRLQLPEEVRQQRIRTWQADWQRKIKQQKAVGDAEALRRLKKARARAQIEIIETITQNINSMRFAEESDLTRIIMLRMIEVLEEAGAGKPYSMLMPPNVMSHLVQNTSAQLQAIVNRSSEEQES